MMDWEVTMLLNERDSLKNSNQNSNQNSPQNIQQNNKRTNARYNYNGKKENVYARLCNSCCSSTRIFKKT